MGMGKKERRGSAAAAAIRVRVVPVFPEAWIGGEGKSPPPRNTFNPSHAGLKAGHFISTAFNLSAGAYQWLNRREWEVACPFACCTSDDHAKGSIGVYCWSSWLLFYAWRVTEILDSPIDGSAPIAAKMVHLSCNTGTAFHALYASF